MRRSMLAVVALFSAAGFPAWAGDAVPPDQLPGPVTQAIKQQFPKGEILSAERETDYGKQKYEVKVMSEGKKYEVDVGEDGVILESEVDED